MAQRIQASATRSVNLSSTTGPTRWKARAAFYKLSSDLHTYVIAGAHTHEHDKQTINVKSIFFKKLSNKTLKGNVNFPLN